MRPRSPLSLRDPGMRERIGGTVVVEALRAHGTDTVFGDPGESILPILETSETIFPKELAA